MKLVVLSRYARLGASSRLRTMQYFPLLEAAGFDVDARPLFPDQYLTRLYDRQAVQGVAARAYGLRARDLRRMGGADLIWLEKEALPWLPWPIERALLPRNVPIVTDYDDAIFHNYDLHRRGLIRRLLGRKIDAVMAASALVTAGNSYLAERARNAGAARVEIVPTVVDLAQYRLRPEPPAGAALKIGWIGSPSTWTDYMAPLMPLMADLAAATGARFVAVGASKEARPSAWCDVLPWSEETEVARIQDMDIGLMPIADTPWAQGKCGYKLIQYMACGLPVVASPVGVNAGIVEHGVNGFLATTTAQWREALLTLAADPDLRRRMGAAGRRKVEACYSLQVWGPRVAAMLAEVARKGRT